MRQHDVYTSYNLRQFVQHPLIVRVIERSSFPIGGSAACTQLQVVAIAVLKLTLRS